MFGRHLRETPGAPPRADGGGHVVVEAGQAAPPWRPAQDALDSLFARLEGAGGPPHYSYSALVRYVSDPAAAPIDCARAVGDFAALMAGRSAPAWANSSRQALLRRIKEAAGGGAVYLADQRAYVREALPGEFPELGVFRIGIEEAFAETSTPGVYAETARFADLRTLSRMRREIRRTGLRPSGADSARLIAVLLGLAQPSAAY